MTRTLILAACLLGLSACASGRSSVNMRDPGISTEKEIIVTLARIEATPEQRAAVLAAFDAARPQIKAMQAERETIQTQLYNLSPRAPDYMERSIGLATQWGVLHEREVLAYARFESAVATALDEARWERWQDAQVQVDLSRRGGQGGRQMRRQ